MGDLLDAALAYCRAGFSVLPLHGINAEGRCTCNNSECNKPGKHPALNWKPLQTEPLVEEQIKKYWGVQPLYNLGLLTNKDLVVCDVDGKVGYNSITSRGVIPNEWEGPICGTGGGGSHLYFRPPQGAKASTSVGLLPGIDMRAEGGYVVLPPSMHASGQRYEWIGDRTLLNTALPEVDVLGQLRSLNGHSKITVDFSGKSDIPKLLKGVAKGGRNEAATKIAGSRAGKGESLEEVLAFCEFWNTRNDPPMDLTELETTCNSVYQKEHANSPDKLSREELMHKASVILSGDESKTLRLELIDGIRIMGDEPKYLLIFDQGSCRMNSAEMLSPTKFQKGILDGTKVVVRKLSNKIEVPPTHDSLIQLLMHICRDVDAGDEATWKGELMGVIREMFRYEKPSEQNLTEVPLGGPFRAEDMMWFDIQDIRRTAGEAGIKHNSREMAQVLTQYGFAQRKFETESGERPCWGTSITEIWPDGMPDASC